MKNNNKKSIIWTITREELVNIISKSNSLTDVLKALNVTTKTGGNFLSLKSRIEFDSIDVTDLVKRRKEQTTKGLKLMVKNKIPLERILVEGSTYMNRSSLKRRLISEGLLEERCYECGINNMWNGKKLTLQLEHRNGINNDNRLENLHLLCPNCHSQTLTFSGRNNVKAKEYKNCLSCDVKMKKSKKDYSGLCYQCYVEKKREEAKPNCFCCSKPITQRALSGLCHPCWNKFNEKRFERRKVQNRPSRKELIELITTKPFVQIGNDYNVSDNAIRKWCKSENLPHRSRDIKAQKDALLKELVVSVIKG